MFGPIHGPWLDESWRGWWGESLLRDIDVVKLGYTCTEHATTPKATQVVLARKASL